MNSAEFARPSQHPTSKSAARTRSSLVFVGPALSPNEALIRRLALDRLRELHDDGVTMAYIGRMYGVSGERMAEVEEELRR